MVKILGDGSLLWPEHTNLLMVHINNGTIATGYYNSQGFINNELWVLPLPLSTYAVECVTLWVTTTHPECLQKKHPVLLLLPREFYGLVLNKNHDAENI